MAAIPLARVHWRSNDELEFALAQACGDIVQAIQALKESRTCPTEHLRDRLLNLSSVIDECESYSVSNNLHFLFVRAQLQVNDVLRLIFSEIGPKASCLNSVGVNSEIDEGLNLASYAKLEYVQLGSLKVPRIFNGLWQLSSPAWGSASLYKQHKALRQLVSVGLIATDMADHYVSYSTPVRKHSASQTHFRVMPSSYMAHSAISCLLRLVPPSSHAPSGVFFERRTSLSLRNLSWKLSWKGLYE